MGVPKPCSNHSEWVPNLARNMGVPKPSILVAVPNQDGWSPRGWLTLNLAIVVRMFERVLITGANGHLGRRLIARLRGNCDVVAAVRSDRAAAMLRKSGAEVRLVDYRDGDALAVAADGCEAAVHLAGIIKETAGNRYVDAHEGTARALCGLDAICRIVYVSVVGAARNSPNACLASKAAAEALLLSGRATAHVLRVPMVLGESDYASLALSARASTPLSFTFRAGSFEQPVYAGDVVDAIVALLETSDAPRTHRVGRPGARNATRTHAPREPRVGSSRAADISTYRRWPHAGGDVRGSVRQSAGDESHAGRAGS